MITSDKVFIILTHPMTFCDLLKTMLTHELLMTLTATVEDLMMTHPNDKW